MDIFEVIATRSSVRAYHDDPAPPEALHAVLQAGREATGLTAGDFRFHLCEHGRVGRQVGGVFGDYGHVITAPHYVVLTAAEGPGWLEDCGYRFEQMVLEATRRGLGTCWIGGLFKESGLAGLLDLPQGHRVVAVTPLGVPSGPTLAHRLMKAAAGSAKRKPVDEVFFWERPGSPLPGDIRNDPAWARVVEAVRRSPSWANKQPWRFVLTPKELVLIKVGRLVKEGKDYHRVDCGIAMWHLRAASVEAGHPGQWRLESRAVPAIHDGEVVARYVFF